MKIITTCLLVAMATLSFAQNKNELLYNAVLAKDTIKTKLFLDDGADANFKKKRGEFEASLLITTVHNHDITACKLLIAHKAEVDFRDWFKTTALMYAAATGDKYIVELLIINGANPNADDGQGNSVLSAAKESKNQELIKYIESLQKKN